MAYKYQFSDTAERFSKIVAELPESSRWQLQLLLLDLEETSMTKSFLNSLSLLSESSVRLEKSVEEFNKNKPSQKETSSFNIRDYRDTAEQTSQAANDIKTLLAEINELLESRRYSSMLNQLLLRVAGLVVLIFVLAVLYRIISVRLTIAKGHKAA
jgi:hypothetical protein